MVTANHHPGCGAIDTPRAAPITAAHRTKRRLLVGFGLDDFLAAVVAARADVMTQVNFAAHGLDGKRRLGKMIVCAVHSTLRCGLLVLLDSHVCSSIGRITRRLSRVNHSFSVSSALRAPQAAIRWSQSNRKLRVRRTRLLHGAAQTAGTATIRLRPASARREANAPAPPPLPRRRVSRARPRRGRAAARFGAKRSRKEAAASAGNSIEASLRAKASTRAAIENRGHP